MREVTTQNDFAAMREVLTRRLSKSSRFAEDGEMEELPDLLVVDGGKGQLSMAMEVIKELDLTGLEVVALAKAKTESDFSSEEVASCTWACRINLRISLRRAMPSKYRCSTPKPAPGGPKLVQSLKKSPRERQQTLKSQKTRP